MNKTTYTYSRDDKGRKIHTSKNKNKFLIEILHSSTKPPMVKISELDRPYIFRKYLPCQIELIEI